MRLKYAPPTLETQDMANKLIRSLRVKLWIMMEQFESPEGSLISDELDLHLWHCFCAVGCGTSLFFLFQQSKSILSFTLVVYIRGSEKQKVDEPRADASVLNVLFRQDDKTTAI